MQLSLQKRLAAQILKCSPKKVRINEERLDDIKEAITNRDIRGLISDGGITKRQVNHQSRSRARHKQEQKRKGKQRGPGKRKGKRTARVPRKQEWMNRIRVQRDLLSELKEKKLFDNKIHRELYKKAGGGFFRSRRHLKLYINERELIKK